MPDANGQPHGTQPSTQRSSTGHPLPRRSSPANSVTLRHHRLARDASLRASPGDSDPAVPTNSTSSRRQSSGESHETGQSDPKKWFDLSNENATATFDNNVMDVDPPFFQKESDSSNEEKYAYPRQAAPPRLTVAQSDSADDYRSVIDDLTVEIQKLKEELKRYKQTGPDTLRKEKLFEIKIHGLPKRKKRELETALRDFTAGLENSPDTSSSRKKSRHTARNNAGTGSGSGSRDNMYSAYGSNSKHASSSSGSNARPVDSAYASMSIGANSSGTSLGRPSTSSRAKSSDQKVENYLRDIPAGLYPRHMAMSDKEKKKLAVRRLEQLFTGKITGRAPRHDPLMPPAGHSSTPLVVAEAQVPNAPPMAHMPPTLATADREAKILPTEQQSGRVTKKSGSRDNGSASNSYGDQTESGGNGNTAAGTNPSPPTAELPEQRPTRPKDLDPDRAQIPSENMEYIRHLGLVPPELLTESNSNPTDVHPDADGWVYLNLLCNLAQLHIINVTPDFVRTAVSEISTKFQLSPDGRKIRWRGGSEGTKFSSDSSGANSQRSPETDETDASDDGQRKRQKTKHSTGDEAQSGSSGNKKSKLGPQASASSDSFHYKPMFVRPQSPQEQTSVDGTLSSFGPVDDSNVDSRWDQSGSSASPRKKRRYDGAIIYYSGAPFCTDLSGDPGDVSPTTYMLSSGQSQPAPATQFARPLPRRSQSGSSLAHRPLSDPVGSSAKMDVDSSPGLTTDSDDLSELDFEPPWSNDEQYMMARPLEPCGLGGVLPDDHFMVVVTTKRPKQDPVSSLGVAAPANSEDKADDMIRRLGTTSSSSSSRGASPAVEIEYVSGRIKRLAPVSLPPPAIFFPPFSNSSSSLMDESESEEDSNELSSSEEFNASRQANPHNSDGYPDGVDLTSGDEDGEDPDEEPNALRMYERKNESTELVLPERRRDSQPLSFSSADVAPGSVRDRSKSVSADAAPPADGSSVATAGGVESGYSSSSDKSN